MSQTQKKSQKQRLQWKFGVLKEMRKKGIWLLDASCHACYYGKKNAPKKDNRLHQKIVNEIVPISWGIYVKHVIQDIGIDSKFVWIVGKGLHDILRELPSDLRGNYVTESNWIYQPNARLPKDAQERKHRIEERDKQAAKLKDAISEACQTP